MKKITGIVAEFNPFHNGHQYLLEQAEGLKIIVMSGNWVQRGAPAIFDKWTRAEMALKNGADLVVEMPTLVSVQAADFFAAGSIQILSQLGVNELVFGSESDTDYNKISELYAHKSVEMSTFIESLPDDFSYPEKTQLMWQKFSDIQFDGNTPNHVLALAYAKACADKKIHLRAIARQVAPHSSEKIERQGNELKFASATAIRNAILAEGTSENGVAEVYPENLEPLYQSAPASWSDYYDFLRYKIISKSDLTSLFQVNDELANRLKNNVKIARNFDQLVELVHTKRYTKARVRRVLTYILLDISDDFQLPDLIHVLGFSKAGQAHLRKVSDKTVVRIGQKPWDEITQRADSIYQLGHLGLKEQNYGRIPIIMDKSE